MVRTKTLLQTLHPNRKFRAWRSSHTFSGTTKSKPLYILGFRRKNFYYVAALAAVVILAAGISSGVSFRKDVREAKIDGAQEAAMGQLVPTQVTQRRTLSMTRGGRTFLTTEVTSYRSTVQRGGGTTMIEITRGDGEAVTVPGFRTYITDSDGSLELQTLIGSTTGYTDSRGEMVETTVFGQVTVLSEGERAVATSTVFEGLTVVTGVDGGISTSLRITRETAEPGLAVTSLETVVSTSVAKFTTTADGMTSTGSSTVEVAVSTREATVSAEPTRSESSRDTEGEKSSTPSPSSSTGTSSSSITSSKSSTSSSSARTSSASSGAGGGGGGAQFTGEATFYTPGLGSCGTDHTESDFVAALSRVLFDATGSANPNNNPYCGRKALVQAAGGSAPPRAKFPADEPGTWYSGSVTFSLRRTRDEKESRRDRVRVGLDEEGIIPSMITSPPALRVGKRQAGGGGVTVTVVDRCPVCKEHDLDLSPAAFDVIGDQAAGRIAIRWRWLD